MKKMWRTIGAFALSVLLWGELYAAPMFNEEFSFIQPDSTFVPVIVNGDEFYQRVEDLNGRTLVRDVDGWICYASLNSDSTELIPGERYTGQNRPSRSGDELHIDLKPEAVKATADEMRQFYNRNIGSRQSRSNTITPEKVVGNMVGLTVLIDFADEPASVTKEDVEELLNSDTGYSVKNYFNTVSGGKLNYTNKVVGYYRAKHNKSYYDKDSTRTGVTELLNEALNWLDSTGFDFSQLTLEYTTVKALNFYYAGQASHGWLQGLWPHKSQHWWEGKTSGYKTFEYQISGLTQANKTIGTFCHENGHMLLGYPDLYAYSGDTEWVGRYCLMGNGIRGNTPMPPNPYFRKLSGWLEYEDITNRQSGTIEMSSGDPVRAILYKNNADPEQFFLMESISRSGKYTSNAPNSGMIVWKINEEGTNTESELNNPLVEVTGGPGFWGTMYDQQGVAFSATTKPASIWPNGSASDIELFNLSPIGATMSFGLTAQDGYITSGDTGTSSGGDDSLFSIATAAQNGTILRSDSAMHIAKGNVVTLTAVPDEGYEFDRWSFDVTGSENPVEVTMNSDKKIMAHFVPVSTEYISMLSGDRNIVRIMHDTLFYDDGGPWKSYSNDFNGNVTFTPGIANKAVKIEFLEFTVFDSVTYANTVYVFDSLEIFDGRDMENSRGSWYGTDNPGVITSTAADGSLTVSWGANSMNTAPGWKARVSLVDKTMDEVTVAQSGNSGLKLGLKMVQNGLQLALPSAGNYSVEIFSTNGRLIETVSGTFHSAGVKNFALNSTAAGVYIARIKLNDTAFTQRLIVK